MEIKTKYEIGDLVYFMYQDKPKRAKVQSISIRISTNYGFKAQIIYTPNNNTPDLLEHKFFDTLEEMAKAASDKILKGVKQ